MLRVCEAGHVGVGCSVRAVGECGVLVEFCPLQVGIGQACPVQDGMVQVCPLQVGQSVSL